MTAGHHGTPPIWRVIFAPLVETVRYFAELDLPRLASWWLWIFIFVALTRRLVGRGYRPWTLYGTSLLLVLGSALISRAVALLLIEQGGEVLSEDYHQWGGRLLLTSGVTLAAALLLAYSEYRRQLSHGDRRA